VISLTLLTEAAEMGTELLIAGKRLQFLHVLERRCEEALQNLTGRVNRQNH